MEQQANVGPMVLNSSHRIGTTWMAYTEESIGKGGPVAGHMHITSLGAQSLFGTFICIFCIF
eukprot:c42087_g1_i1 orf=56-241(-)